MRPYDRTVEVLLATVLGLAIGLGVGPAMAWVRRRAQADQVAEPQSASVSAQLAAAIDLLHAAALVAGPSDEVLHANSQSRAVGLVRGDRVAPGELLELVRDARSGGQVTGKLLRLRREPGVPRLELAVRSSALEGGVVLVIADDRSAEVRADEIKRDFVANVSHELKTPVGAIQVLAEAVEQAAGDPEAVHRFAGRMISESERLTELIRQIIELSRLQSDDPLLQPVEVDIDRVVAAAVGQCRDLASSRSVTLNAAGSAGLLVLGDPEQLISALVNLILNGINYSDPGARVSVTSREVSDASDRFVELSVTDNGIGVKSEDLQRIFERFYRVDYARSRATGGTGLGLSIVKHIAGAHGGTVDVWSKVGQGSTFTLRLPASHEVGQPEEGMP